MKKILSMVMCFAMLLGLFSTTPPENVKAASYEQGGDTCEEAIEWDTDETLYGIIEEKYDTNYWSFTTGEEKVWYYFKAVNIYGGAKFQILDKNKDKVVSFGTGSDDYGNYAKLEPQSVYYVAAESHMYKECKFELSVTTTKDDFTDSIEDASEVVSGKKYTANLDSPTDDDYFYFTAGATESTISVTASNTRVEFSVYNEDGEKLGISNSYSKQLTVRTGEKGTASYETKIGEKYYVLAETWTSSGFSSASFGKYIFTINSRKVVPLQINATVVNMNKGMSFNVTGLLTDSNGDLSFSSSKSTVASVSKTGVIIAKKAGKATITVKNSDGKKVKLSLVVK